MRPILPQCARQANRRRIAAPRNHGGAGEMRAGLRSLAKRREIGGD
jgi:hypothetical protein